MPARTELVFAVQPWADVELDGVKIGTTPMDAVDVAPGLHKVVLRRTGYRDYKRTFTVEPGKRFPLRVGLTDWVPLKP